MNGNTSLKIVKPASKISRRITRKGQCFGAETLLVEELGVRGAGCTDAVNTAEVERDVGGREVEGRDVEGKEVRGREVEDGGGAEPGARASFRFSISRRMRVLR